MKRKGSRLTRMGIGIFQTYGVLQTGINILQTADVFQNRREI